jgi:hypothetical protein
MIPGPAGESLEGAPAVLEADAGLVPGAGVIVPLDISTVPDWATVDDVLAFLRIAPATAQDLAEVGACTDAANAWCFRRRGTAGYFDDPAIVPGPDVLRAVVLLAGELYREGGGTDGFPSFAELPPGIDPGGTFSQVKRLLGVNRPVIA